MNSKLAEIYLGVQAHLNNTLGSAGTGLLKWIDQDLGQLEIATTPEVLFPCTLFDFVNGQYSDVSDSGQIGDMVLQVRIGLGAFAQASNANTQTQKENALRFYDIEHEVIKALHGFRIDGMTSPLSRTSGTTEQREDNLRVRTVQFGFAYMDNVARPVLTTVPTPTVVLLPG